MTKPCPHAASGCNYPEAECLGHCAGKRQPEAMRLADELEKLTSISLRRDLEPTLQAAAELRRQHAENEDFRATIDHLTRENAEQIGELVALKERCNELLEALRRIADPRNVHFAGDAQVVARDAIAKVEGETK